MSTTTFAKGDAVTVSRRADHKMPAPKHVGAATVIWASPDGKRYEVAMADGSGTCHVFDNELSAR